MRSWGLEPETLGWTWRTRTRTKKEGSPRCSSKSAPPSAFRPFRPPHSALARTSRLRYTWWERDDLAAASHQAVRSADRCGRAFVRSPGGPDRGIPRAKWSGENHDLAHADRDDRAVGRLRHGVRDRFAARPLGSEAAGRVCARIRRRLRIAHRPGVSRD